MYYDEAKFQELRAKAVTTVDGLVVGRKYYTNSHPEQFVIKDLLTQRQEYERRDIKSAKEQNNTVPAWIVYDTIDFYGDPYEASMSMQDNNIGESYNPWLIFEREEDAIEARKLEISYPYEEQEYHDYYE